MMPAHQIERVACDDLAKADERRAWLQVLGLHDPHRPTPGDVDRVSEESRYAVTRNGRVDQFDLDTLAGIKPERVRGVEWRVKYGAKVFSEPDWHDEDRFVPLGKNKANQFEASKLVNPCSCADAWAGRPGERSRVRIAIALTILL